MMLQRGLPLAPQLAGRPSVTGAWLQQCRCASGGPNRSGKRGGMSRRGPRNASRPGPAAAPEQQGVGAAPVPNTVWDAPLFRHASRTPPLALPELGNEATKRPTLSQKETFKATTLYFQPHASWVQGTPGAPLMRAAPPIAVPNDAQVKGDKTAALRERVQQARDLYARQVRGGDYTPYEPRSTLRNKELLSPDAMRRSDRASLVFADQAVCHNTSMHPAARQFVVDRVADYVGVKNN